MGKIKLIINVFRPIRWYRNLFMFLGSFLALRFNDINIFNVWYSVLISFIALCLVASANYGINEVFDAESDSHHPKKKFRAIPSGRIAKKTIVIISLILYLVGFGVAYSLGNTLLLLSVFLIFISGILYNLPPFRLKDIPYMDFTFEALNNPIRLFIGWYAVSLSVIPISIILFFFFIGIFLMSAKRFGELRFIENPGEAELYRKSLGFYTEKRLLFIMIGSISASMYMFGILTARHNINLAFSLPFVLIFIVWFFNLAYEKDSVVKDPERIFEKKHFLFFILFLAAVFIFLIQYNGIIINF
ncbi:MAG: UbiA family prenyltransferase [Minisyncoccia bacterium]